MLDLLSNLEPESNPNPLTTLVLGGRTQLEAALDAQPTFVSIWIGNNDVLGAAVSGMVTEDNVTPPQDFSTRLSQSLNELENGGVAGGVLIGVADVTLIPHLSSGAAYWVAAQGDALPTTFQVADSCAPSQFGGLGEETLVPFGYGFGELMGQAMEGRQVTLDCAQDLQVLSNQEIGELVSTVAAYNDILAQEAASRGWAFFNPNPIFRELYDEGFIPPFPAVQIPSQLFGPVFSLDGVHPSGLGHRLVANGVMEAINETYGTGLDPVDIPDPGVTAGSTSGAGLQTLAEGW
jgi:lysophospholipase L1-like esterase